MGYKKSSDLSIKIRDFLPYAGLDCYRKRISSFQWDWDKRMFVNSKTRESYQQSEKERIENRLLLLKIWNFGIMSPLAGISLAYCLAFLADKSGCLGFLEKICN